MAFRRLGYAGMAILAIVAMASDSEGQTSDRSTPSRGQAGDVVRLDAISVTATRNPIQAFEYPGMVSVVGRRDFEVRQPSTPDDILNFVPSVQFTGGPRRTGETPSIRGFSGPDVVVIIDGARQNLGSTHDGRFFIDPSLIERVEVLRGPASSLYGSGGTGGLIGFRTLVATDLLPPGEKAGATATVSYWSVNSERVGNVTAYAAPREGIDLLASVTKRDSGTIELGDGNELRNADDDIVASLAKAGFSLADHHRIDGAVIGFRNDAREPNNSQEGVDSGQTAVGLVDKRIRAETLRVAYSYDNPANDLLDLDLVAYRTDFQVDELRLEDVRSGPAGELLKRDVDTVGLRLDNRSRVAPLDDTVVTLTYGGEYWRDEQDGADGGMRDGRPDSNAGERDGVPDADAGFFGFFAQAEIAISEAFGTDSGDVLIIPGVRYDEYTVSSSDRLGGDNEHDEFSPRLGLSWLPSDWLMLFASYAHAFRAPTVNEIYLTGVHFPLFRDNRLVGFNRFESNPDLKPQATRTVELGAGVTFDDVAAAHDRLQVKATRFSIKGEDFIETAVRQAFPVPAGCIPFTSDRARIPTGPPGTFSTGCEGGTYSSNVPNATLDGVEIEASYENARIRVGLGFSTIDGKNEDTGRRLSALTLSPDRYTVAAGLKLPEIDSIIGWRMLAAERFDKVDNPAEERAAYTVHDFHFSWRPSGELKGLNVDLGIDNAFDEAYTRVDTAAAEPGRNLKASIGYSLTW